MAFTPSKLRQIHECLDRMSKRMDEMEVNQNAHHDTEDRELEDEPVEGNTMPVAPSAPFADSPPSHIHGESKEDQVASPWGRKAQSPYPY